MIALRLAALLGGLLAVTAAQAQTTAPQRPAPPPIARPAAPVVAPAPAPAKPAPTLTGAGLAPLTGLQSFAANGSFLKGLNPGDPAPQCRARCGSDRAFCGAGGGDDSCDGVWRQCLAGCRAAQ